MDLLLFNALWIFYYPGVKCQCCLVYLDEVIIYSNSKREHIDHVDQILGILRRAGLSLKFSKSHFIKKSVNSLGHTIRPGKLEIAVKRTEAQFPKTQTQVRSFLGLCNVYRRFVKGFAKAAAPLNDLFEEGMS